MDATAVTELVSDSVYGLWYIVGAVLVFFMQAGFAMVETGFTRAKNAGNIIMKNLMDFCIGTVAFLFLGYGIMCGENALGGFIGMPTMTMLSLGNFDDVDWSNFFFQLVFCATAATIVSGSMAERTKFSAYVVYSLFISLVIYPVEAHWVWGGGWLSEMGYFDWAGSTVIHMVGGTMAFIGAMFVGPRLGKYDKDGKPNAIAGHSITLGALGCFILWFGWYGFNGAAGTTVQQVAQIFVTTTIGAAVAACTTMAITWVKDGKPDVSMTLNASLAGLVGITAPCAVVDSLGALVVGIVSGIITVVFVNVIDRAGVDDPVGAVTVHAVNGIWGGIAVGLLANPNIIDAYGVSCGAGLFYGGGFAQLGVQLLGIICILAWTAVCAVILFGIIKATIGLRVSADEEVEGLDISEHGLPSAYADFLPSIPPMGVASGESVDLSGLKPALIEHPSKMSCVSIICNKDKFVQLKEALAQIGVTGMTVSNVMGCGIESGKTGQYRGVKTNVNLLPKLKVDIVVSEVDPALVVAAANRVLHTGEAGDGKVFVAGVEDAYRISTGQTGVAALDMTTKVGSEK
ncbi:MAG: ammonium transporter [Coriobacteriales bacterium]